jgi:tRNA-binding EMAP/Myf-like protein
MFCFLKKILGLNKDTSKSSNCCGNNCCSKEKKRPLLPIKGNEENIIKALDAKIVIGKIHVITDHPDPKVTKVRITQTEIAPGEMRQVLCGAKNIAVGQIVPVATVGAKLSETFEIGERKIRGELSQGMICAKDELGLTKENDGIWELPSGFENFIGESLNKF